MSSTPAIVVPAESTHSTPSPSQEKQENRQSNSNRAKGGGRQGHSHHRGRKGKNQQQRRSRKGGQQDTMMEEGYGYNQSMMAMPLMPPPFMQANMPFMGPPGQQQQLPPMVQPPVVNAPFQAPVPRQKDPTTALLEAKSLCVASDQDAPLVAGEKVLLTNNKPKIGEIVDGTVTADGRIGVVFGRAKMNILCEKLQRVTPVQSIQPQTTGPIDKQAIGGRLYQQLSGKVHPDLRAKVTGMLLDLTGPELLELIDSQVQLHAKVNECIQALTEHHTSLRDQEAKAGRRYENLEAIALGIVPPPNQNNTLP